MRGVGREMREWEDETDIVANIDSSTPDVVGNETRRPARMDGQADFERVKKRLDIQPRGCQSKEPLSKRDPG